LWIVSCFQGKHPVFHSLIVPWVSCRCPLSSRITDFLCDFTTSSFHLLQELFETMLVSSQSREQLSPLICTMCLNLNNDILAFNRLTCEFAVLDTAWHSWNSLDQRSENLPLPLSYKCFSINSPSVPCGNIACAFTF
jgi:hypothetical protein